MFHLLNTKLARVPGVNPLTFQNLEEYTEFVKWQRSNGINCPVLFLQHTYNVQGNSEYKVFENPAYFQPCGLAPEPPEKFVFPIVSFQVIEVPLAVPSNTLITLEDAPAVLVNPTYTSYCVS